jgi:hypothetical protein
LGNITGGDEWNGAVALLKAWLVHQPAPIPIAVMLAAAFSLVMFIEGLRVNFVPARYTTRSRIVRTREKPESKTSNFVHPSAPHAIAHGSLLHPIPRFVPKQQPLPRRVYGAPRPTVCHRIKLEMVNLEPIAQALPLADQD